MSSRAHLWLRLASIAVIALAAAVPRMDTSRAAHAARDGRDAAHVDARIASAHH